MGIGIAGAVLFVALQFLWSSAPRAGSSPPDTTAASESLSSAVAPGQEATLHKLLQQSDSTKARGDTAEAVDRFVPVSTSFVKTTDVDMSIGSRMDISVDAGKGWLLSSGLSYDKRIYRQRDFPELSMRFEGDASKARPGVYSLNISLNESYRKSKTSGRGRFGQWIIHDIDNAGARLALTKPILRASTSRLSLTAGARRGTNDFKFDRSLQGTASAALSYTIGDSLFVRGSGGTSRRSETSDIVQFRFGPMRSNADSITAGLSYGKGQNKILSVSYGRTRGVDRIVVPPTGNTYEILSDPTKARQEEIRNKVDVLTINSFLMPLPFLTLGFDFSHTVDDKKYMVDTRQTKYYESNLLKSAIGYRYASSGSLNFGVSTSEDLSDRGPVSLSSYRQRQHSVRMALDQMLGDSISFSAEGSGVLQQRFSLKRQQNPSDFDNLIYHGELKFSAPFRRVRIDVKTIADRLERINIDSTRSADNRVDYAYELGPTVTVRPAAWISLSQYYALKIDYVDFVFTEDKNYLNRTTTLVTSADFRLFRGLWLAMRHSYLMRDTGSYLMRDGKRRYRPTNDTRDNMLDLDLRYEVVPGFELLLLSGFNIQEARVFGSEAGKKTVVSTATFESGDMRAGFTRTREIGGFGDIKLDFAYVRYFGPNITPEKREYVEASSTMTLNF